MTDHDGKCEICLEPIRDNDLCLTDIDLGPCHAKCLEGSTMVNLDTGEPLGSDEAAPVPYFYGVANDRP